MERSCISSHTGWLSLRVISECDNSRDGALYRLYGDGLLWLGCKQAPLEGIGKKSACVLIVSVTHSLCVFMWLLVITVHVCLCISVSQSTDDFKAPQGNNYPLNNLRLELSTHCEIWYWMLIDVEVDCYVCGGGRQLESSFFIHRNVSGSVSIRNSYFITLLMISTGK